MPKAKPISKDDLLRAMKYSKSIRSAARYLGCSYHHVKPYFKMYKDEDGISFFEKHYNQQGKGINKFLIRSKKTPNTKEIVEQGVGWESFSVEKIKTKLILDGYLADECYHCGFKERRVTDYKTPLLLNFKDGMKCNYLLDNIELLCYNCYFLYISDPFTTNEIRHFEDHQEVKEKAYDWKLEESYLANMKALGIAGEV